MCIRDSFSIAKNLVLRELQRKERVAAVDSTEDTTDIALRRARQDTPGGLLPDERSPERTFADGELQEITRVFIGTLTDEQRQFFQHRFVHGLTQEATADVMAVTRARVKLLEKGMRRRFLEALRQAGYFVDYTPKPRWSCLLYTSRCV